MASSTGVLAAMAALAANPWLWSALVAFFLGAALGQGLRWLRARLREDQGGAARRSSRAVIALAIAVGAAAAFLVFPPKSGLAPVSAELAIWASILGFLGLACGILPRLGLPAALVLALGSGGLVLDAGRGWIRLDGPGPVARLTPFSREGGTWKGELILYERDSVPTTLPVAFGGESAALVVERLDLSGPATLLGPAHSYRVVGLSDGSVFALRFPGRTSLLDRLAPLDPEALTAGRGSLVRRSRLPGEARPLAPLAPAYFAFVRAGTGEGFVFGASGEAFPEPTR